MSILFCKLKIRNAHVQPFKKLTCSEITLSLSLICTCLFQDILLDCPILVDLSHGTIRHRMPDEKYDTDGTSKVKTGYFYHARLKDYSEG